jgi:hypothetical protein
MQAPVPMRRRYDEGDTMAVVVQECRALPAHHGAFARGDGARTIPAQSAKAMTLRLLDDLTQPFVLRMKQGFSS